MKFFVVFTFSISFLISTTAILAQNTEMAVPKPTPPAGISATIAQNTQLQPKNDETSRQRREEAYKKLLEGQRYLWNINRLRSQSAVTTTARLAKLALQKAVELDPNLGEAYTALAELALKAPPNDIEEAITMASLAIKVDRNNFGAHKILSRLYTIKSNLNEGKLEVVNTQKAILEWKEIARLDPRNAEAWAFLSEFYQRTDKKDEAIEALQNWLSASTPLETRFYRSMMGNQGDLSPESAGVKLGAAYLDAGRIQEAVEVLNNAVADEPENLEAIELLRQALESADSKTGAIALETLQQAIYANPENTALVLLFAQVQARNGKVDEATAFLKKTIDKLAESDKINAANLQISLGDIFLDAERYDDAIASYRKALVIRGIDQNALATDDEREFAVNITEKIIQIYKLSNRFAEAKTEIEKSRSILGKEDSFSDRQLIALYRETNKKQEALQAVRTARQRFPDDVGFLRLEASILAESGKVEEGVKLIKSLIGKKINIVPSMYDDFSNYLFISLLYSNAKRGKEAIEAANQAYNLADGEERKQIAKLQLATVQQMSGDFKSAEATLREILAQSPNNPIAQNNLGYFLVERDEKLEEALQLIQKAIKTDPTSPTYLDSLGWAYFKLGKFDSAEENLKKAMRLDPLSATILEHLGDVYQKQGKTEMAKTTWQKALNLSSDTEQENSLKQKLGKKTNK